MFYLKVRNNGAEARFKAQITLSSEDDPQVWRLTTYDGYWQMSNGNESKILPNQYDSIKIAERRSYPPDYNSVHLRIFYYNPKLVEALYSSEGEAHCDTSSYWVGAYIEKEDGSKTPLEKHEYDLRVSISSSPSLREKMYIESFKLDIDTLRISHSSQSVSHKEGSQS